MYLEFEGDESQKKMYKGDPLVSNRASNELKYVQKDECSNIPIDQSLGLRGADKIVIQVSLDPDSIDLGTFIPRIFKEEKTNGIARLPNFPEVHVRWNNEGHRIRIEFNPSNFTRHQGLELCPFELLPQICQMVLEKVVYFGDPKALFEFQIDKETGEISAGFPPNWADHVLVTRIDLAQDFVISNQMFKVEDLKYVRPLRARGVSNFINGKRVNTVSHVAGDRSSVVKIYDKYAERKKKPVAGAKPLAPGHTRFEALIKYADLKKSQMLCLSAHTPSALNKLLREKWETSNYHENLTSAESLIKGLLDDGMDFGTAGAMFTYLYARDQGFDIPLQDRILRELRKSIKSFGMRLSDGIRQNPFAYGYLDLEKGTLSPPRIDV